MPSAKLTALVSLAGGQVPTDLAYVVDVSAGAAGSKSSTLNDLFAIPTRNITDGAVRFQGFAAPALSAAGQGAIYFDSTANAFRVSENAGAYRAIGDVTGPAGATDEGIARFDGATGKLLQNSIVTISDAGAFTFPDNVRQVFNPGATVAGLNTGSLAGDPSTPINGDLWYDSTGNLLRARINGASVSLGTSVPGGLDTQVQRNAAGVFGGISGFTSDGTNVTAGDGNLRATSPLITTGIDDANGNTILGLSPAASAVNFVNIANAAAGGSAVVSTVGGSADISLTFSPKGAGLNTFTKNLLFNVGSGALDNLIYVGATTAVAVNASFGFFVAGVGSDESQEGPYFLARGNTFTALGNQRGSMIFAAGSPGSPTQTEGSISFFTNFAEQLRARIGRAGSGLPLLALTQANTSEIGLDVNNPSGSTAAIATFSVNAVPLVTINSDANSYFGNGVVNTVPANYILNATGGSGTNIAGADLYFAGGKGTGTGAQGLAAFRYPLTGASGTTLQTLSTASFPPWVSMFIRNDGDVTVANTTTETSILGAAQGNSTKTIEAGLARVARAFWLRIWGTITTTGTPTVQFRLKFGATTLVDLGAVTMANNTNGGLGNFYLEALVTIRSVGATGTVHVFPFRFNYSVSGGGPVNQSSSAAAPTVDLTAAQTFDVTVQWGTANASNSITAAHAFIDMAR